MSDERARLEAEMAKVEQAIVAQENLRGILSDEDIEASLAKLRHQAIDLQAQLSGIGAVAQGQQSSAATNIGEGAAIGRDVQGHVVIAKDGARVYIGEQPVEMPAVDRRSALGRYLQHLISRNRYLQLQGIRSGGRLVNIELDQIYVSLRATRQRLSSAETEWLAHETTLAPGEKRRHGRQAQTVTETVVVSVNEVLKAHKRLVVLGDPGSGKTTLLRYLTLLYARDLAQNTGQVSTELDLDESGYLPILLPLRQIGAFLRHQPDDGTQGHTLLLDFLFRSLKSERINFIFLIHITPTMAAKTLRQVKIFRGWCGAGRSSVRRRASAALTAAGSTRTTGTSFGVFGW